MSQASEVELSMLELINQERTSRGLDALAINAELNESSEDHSQWMLDNDVFSHTGQGGTGPRQRIENTNYNLEGNWSTAENIGMQSERGAPGIEDDVRDIHEGLMASPGHRANILNPELEDIGIGVELGDFNGYDAVMITQNFGTTDAVSDAPNSGEVPNPEPETPVADADDVVDPILIQDPASGTPPTDDTPMTDDDDGVPEAPTPTGDLEGPETPSDDDVADDDEEPVDGDMADCSDNGDETADPITVTTGMVTNTVTSSTIARDGADSITIMIDQTEEAEMTGMLDDFFDFKDFDVSELDGDPDDVSTIITDFEGTLTTADGAVTTENPAEFDMMLADLFEDLGSMMCDVNIDFI